MKTTKKVLVDRLILVSKKIHELEFLLNTCISLQETLRVNSLDHSVLNLTISQIRLKIKNCSNINKLLLNKITEHHVGVIYDANEHETVLIPLSLVEMTCRLSLKEIESKECVINILKQDKNGRLLPEDDLVSINLETGQVNKFHNNI